MPLPENNTPWPPEHQKGYQRDYAEADAWYSGDPAKLAAFYGTTGNEPKGARGFWTRRQRTDRSNRMSGRIHVPAAADVAATSADLLFGEPPKIQIPEAHETEANASAKATEDRLTEIIETTDMASTLLEAAEICAGIGGVYLRPLWDTTTVSCPVLTVVHADHALPEFRWGQLVAVTFWSVVLKDGNVWWRHLERHEPGRIVHGLYAGNQENLGIQQPLDIIPQTQGIAADENGITTLPDGIKGLAVRYVPNALPNRKRRGSPIGRADTAGSESLMDALDDTMTSWVRDIRLGQGRIIVPSEFLERTGRGEGATFDIDREVFSPLEMDPAHVENAGITIAQFEIRAEQHAATAQALFERIVVTAGYSPQTFGMHGDGGQQTATEVRAREGRSHRTTSKKERYFRAALGDVLEMMLIIDRDVFGSRLEVFRPRIDFADADAGDQREVASSLNLINLAQAASIETKVKMLNPEWDQPTVDAEVARIRLEQGIGPVGDPTGGMP